jgi:hypothetical protein
MSEERYALVFDSEVDSLGAVALRLLRMGIDVVYAQPGDEALLLADDVSDRVQALIVPPSVSTVELGRISQRLAGSREGKPPSVIVIGEPPSEEVRQELRAAGASWAVWNPDDDNALRFAVNGALTLPSELVPRSEPRVPTNLMASFSREGARTDAIAYTLSAKGAFLETPSPESVGSMLQVEIWLPSLRVTTNAKVVYVKEIRDRARASWPVGMGIVFEGMGERREARVRRYVEQRAESTTV